MLFIKKYSKFLFLIPIVLIVGYLSITKFLYFINFHQYDYMLSYGKYYDLDKNLEIINKKNLINVKMRAKEVDLLKPKSFFEFLDKNGKKILEITVYKDPNVSDIYDGYHYYINPDYLITPRKYDSYLKLFCDGNFNTCYFTFSFLMTEPKVDFLNEVDTYVMDGKKLKFVPRFFDYDKRHTENDRKNIKYIYNDNKVEICTKYDHFYYVETLRITTTLNGDTEQKVCPKEENPSGCCTLNTDTTKFSDISILHWKGDLNAGQFQEFSIKLK